MINRGTLLLAGMPTAAWIILLIPRISSYYVFLVTKIYNPVKKFLPSLFSLMASPPLNYKQLEEDW